MSLNLSLKQAGDFAVIALNMIMDSEKLNDCSKLDIAASDVLSMQAK
jgi:hypothetical protein